MREALKKNLSKKNIIDWIVTSPPKVKEGAKKIARGPGREIAVKVISPLFAAYCAYQYIGYVQDSELRNMMTNIGDASSRELTAIELRKLCHKKQQQAIVSHLNDREKTCILVKGARGSGKSWTTEFAVHNWANPKKDRFTEFKEWFFGKEKKVVIQVKSRGCSTVEGIVSAFKEAMKYEESKSASHIIGSFFHLKKQTQSSLAQLENILNLIERKVSEDKINEYVILLDDIEDLHMSNDPNVDTALRLIRDRIKAWGSNNFLRSIAVSSSYKAADFFTSSRAKECRQVAINDLTETEAINYVKLACQQNGFSVSTAEARDITTQIGLRVADLRTICDNFKQLKNNKQVQLVENDTILPDAEITKEVAAILADNKTLISEYVHMRNGEINEKLDTLYQKFVGDSEENRKTIRAAFVRAISIEEAKGDFIEPATREKAAFEQMSESNILKFENGRFKISETNRAAIKDYIESIKETVRKRRLSHPFPDDDVVG